jgi:hypothetical protein
LANDGDQCRIFRDPETSYGRIKCGIWLALILAVAQLPHGTGSDRFRISAVAGQLRY